MPAGIQTRNTGRYTHRADYLLSLIRQQGCRTLHLSQEIVPTNLGKPAPGRMVMLQKIARMPSCYSDTQIDRAVEEILSNHYADIAGVQGWLFTTLIDSPIFRRPLESAPNSAPRNAIGKPVRSPPTWTWPQTTIWRALAELMTSRRIYAASGRPDTG